MPRPYSQWDEYRDQRQDNADAAANDAAIGPAIYYGDLPYPANEPDGAGRCYLRFMAELAIEAGMTPTQIGRTIGDGWRSGIEQTRTEPERAA